MSKDSLNHRFAPLLLSLFVGLGTYISLWPDNFTGFTISLDHTQNLMFFLLTGGLLFFLLSKSRLMVICFVGCAFICYDLNEKETNYLNSASTENNQLIRVGIYNLYAHVQAIDESLDIMCDSNTDFISIKAIPNHQFLAVKDYLHQCGYSFHHYLEEKHPSSVQAIFAKDIIPDIDSFYLTQTFFDTSTQKVDTNQLLTFQKILGSKDLKYLKYKTVQEANGVIQTYQLINQKEPALHAKKTSQKL